MKADIHPEYNREAEITCSCGNVVKAGSTASNMSVEICAACHPFFTGAEKVIDTAGRVEKFKARQEKAKQAKESAKKRT